MAGGCIVGDFQIDTRQSSQHSSCRIGASFFKYMEGGGGNTHTPKVNKEVNLLMFVYPSSQVQRRTMEKARMHLLGCSSWVSGGSLHGPGNRQHLTRAKSMQDIVGWFGRQKF